MALVYKVIGTVEARPDISTKKNEVDGGFHFPSAEHHSGRQARF